MQAALDDPDAAMREAELRLAHIRAGFSVAHMTDQIEALYRQVLVTRRRRLTAGFTDCSRLPPRVFDELKDRQTIPMFRLDPKQAVLDHVNTGAKRAEPSELSPLAIEIAARPVEPTYSACSRSRRRAGT